MDRLRVSHDNLTILNKNCRNMENLKTSGDEKEKLCNLLDDKNDEIRSKQEIIQILRVMTVLKEYINEFDANYLCERIFPPLIRLALFTIVYKFNTFI